MLGRLEKLHFPAVIKLKRLLWLCCKLTRHQIRLHWLRYWPLNLCFFFFWLYSFIFFKDLLSCAIFYGFNSFFFLNVQLLSLFCNQLKPMKISYIKIHYKFIIRCRFANESLYENMSRTLIMKSICFAICENYLPPVANTFWCWNYWEH